MLTFDKGISAIRGMIASRRDIGPNNCKMRAREAFGIPSNGTPTATASWNAAPDQHRGGNPAAAPAYSFGWATGGSAGAGHVWVNIGNGRILTPGGPRDDRRWYETTAAELLRGWSNLRYAGWTYSIDGRAPERSAPKPPAPKQPTRVQRALQLLRDAARQAKRNGRPERAKRINDGAGKLPRR